MGGNRIGRITPSGVVTEFSAGISASASPYAIAAGADGNLWFTEAGPDRIGRITTAGVITEYPMTAGATPYGITDGPDGNVWFAEGGGNRIGRITPAGVVTEFSAGISSGAYPQYITAGPDGNLWFTELGGNRIGRITTAGVVTEFSAGISAGANPYGITAGPDGNVWFTEIGGNRIGRITMNGTITEFSAGISAPSYAIIAGPDGNLWFMENGQNRIGRITPAGVVTEFNSSNVLAADITSGPDGNLWFTVSGHNEIGQIMISSLAVQGVTLSKTSPFSAQVGSASTPQSVTLSNTGNASLNIASIVANGDFAQSNGCGPTLASGSSCTISVTFTPTAAGPDIGNLTITSDAAGSPQLVSLSGTGLAVPVIAPTSTTTTISTTTTTQAPTTTTASITSTTAVQTTTTTVASNTTTTLPGSSATLNFIAGWNLVGNSSSESLDAATAFGDASKVTSVWKWLPASANWAFYTPTVADGGAAYAASKNYDVLTTINGGEGFWVNAKAAFTAQLPSGTAETTAWFKSMPLGWNLIAIGDNQTPSQFNQLLSASPPAPGVIPLNVTSLWAWDSVQKNWYFYAPSLDSAGTLSSYIASKGYLDFGTKVLDPTTGFWVYKQ